MTSAGTLGLPDNSSKGFKEIGSPIDTRPLEQTTTQLYEVGYKGIFGKKLLLTMDLYYANKKNFVSPLSFITPFVYLQKAPLQEDLLSALTHLLSNTTDPTLSNNLASLQASGLTIAEIAGMLSTMVGDAMANQSVAVVQTRSTHPPPY